MNGMAGVMPMSIKHRAMDKSGMPVYQPTNAAAASYPPLVQFSQQPFVPVTRKLPTTCAVQSAALRTRHT